MVQTSWRRGNPPHLEAGRSKCHGVGGSTPPGGLKVKTSKMDLCNCQSNISLLIRNNTNLWALWGYGLSRVGHAN